MQNDSTTSVLRMPRVRKLMLTESGKKSGCKPGMNGCSVTMRAPRPFEHSQMSRFGVKRTSAGAVQMSAFGPKQTYALALHMSAFGGKADMTFGTCLLSQLLLGLKRTYTQLRLTPNSGFIIVLARGTAGRASSPCHRIHLSSNEQYSFLGLAAL